MILHLMQIFFTEALTFIVFVLRYFIRYVILPRVRSYGDNSTVTLSPGSILIKCILILPEMWARMR